MTDLSKPFTRRDFLASTSCFGAAYAVARLIPLPGLSESVAGDARVAQTPIVDKGFASVRKIGEGAYATISDPSKGYTTLCNGGFLAGKDAALLIEGYASPTGCAFQMDALRMVSQVPARAALDTHYHFDHSMGNSFYGAHNVAVWAHAKVPTLMAQNYGGMQTMERAAFLEPLEKKLREAKTDAERQHAQSDVNAATGMYDTVHANLVALPSRPLDPAKLPEKIDLGGLTAIVESYPGHTAGDLIVRVPEQKIVYTGDLLFSGWYPVTFDATISGWRATLKKFAAFDKDTIFVPGHGQICGQEGIATESAVFDDIAEQAQKMYKAGVPAEEAAHRYAVPDKFKSFPIFAWGFTISPTIAKLYAEWKGSTP